MRLLNKFIAPGRGHRATFQYSDPRKGEFYYLVNEYHFAPPSRYTKECPFYYDHNRYCGFYISPRNHIEIKEMHIVYADKLIELITIEKTSRDGRYSKICNIYED